MYKILLTVDDAIAQKNFQDQLQLKLSGSEFIFTKDSQETVSLLTQGGISLVVLDLNSFQVDSLSILSMMSYEYPETPCFILGDHTLLDTKTKSELYHYYQKPYDLEEVTSEIAHVIRDDVLPSTPKGLPVSTFTQLISKEAKTCLIGIYPPDGNKGLFYFEKGILFDAVQSNLKGEAAAKKMLSLEGAQIRFKDIQKKIARKINTSLLAIIERVDEPMATPLEEAPPAPTAKPVKQTTQPDAPKPPPVKEPEPIAAPIEEVQEVEEDLPEVELEPLEDEVESEEEAPLFSGPEETTEPPEPQTIENLSEPETITEEPEAQEKPPTAKALEEVPAESIPEEAVEEQPPMAKATEEKKTPEEPERPKTRDYFEEPTAPQEDQEAKTKAPEKAVVEQTETESAVVESAPEKSEEDSAPTAGTQENETEEVPEAQAIEKQPAPEETERPKTIDYFEKVETQQTQQESAAPATEKEAEPEAPKTRDYVEYVVETPKEEINEEAASEPAETAPSETEDAEQPEPVDDIVSILEAEPGEVDEEFDDVVEEASADEILEEPEIIEEEKEEIVLAESPEPEPEVLTEPIEEDIWMEPAETVEEEPEEIISEVVEMDEEGEDQEKVSNETMEEVVAPIETAIQEEAPQPASEIETDPKKLWDNNIGDLREIRGYRAAAVLNFNGEVALFDSVDPTIQLNTIGATFNSLFWLSQDAFNRVGLKEFNELILSTPSGLVVMISSGKETPRQFHLIGILAEDGNQNLMRFKFGNLAHKLKDVPA